MSMFRELIPEVLNSSAYMLPMPMESGSILDNKQLALLSLHSRRKHMVILVRSSDTVITLAVSQLDMLLYPLVKGFVMRRISAPWKFAPL